MSSNILAGTAPPSAYLALAVTFVALAYWLLARDSRLKHLPPGPKGLPLIGSMLEMSDIDSMPKRAAEWAREYGEIFHTKVGLEHYIWLSSPQAVKDLMDKRGNIYSSRAHAPMINLVSNENRVNFMPYNDKWRKVRNLLHAALNLETSVMYKPVQDFETKSVLWELLHVKDDHEFYNINRRYSASVIMLVTYGRRITSWADPLYDEIFTIIRHFTLASAPGVWIADTVPSLAKYIPSRLLQNWKNIGRKWHEEDAKVYMRLYNDCLEKIKDGTAPDCFIKDIETIGTRKNNVGPELAAYTAGALIEAGSDATTTALNNVILACLLYPEVVEKAHEELDRVVGKDRMPTFDDEPNLPYIRGFAKETLRWRATTKVGTCHATTKDDWYKGYFIPKGAVVVLNWWALHYDTERFEDPDRFDPSRYIDDTLTPAEAMNSPDPMARGHFTFGAGRRYCPGIHVAHNSLFINIARILWAYNIRKSVDANGDVLEPPLNAEPGFLLTPVKFPCHFEIRSQQHADIVEKTWAEAQREGLDMRKLRENAGVKKD
ncbi:Cytochrome P450 monooxygenase yanC [Lasiodiplodia theobromae]|uniref:Cytochrome P450 monooxygenase yanC n=1 Tax=Lasiodiplodia theobromae TaxID=45133 RepID=A0A5N5DBW5_9PEZI|nr:Cytochrome P450 monooxygenase yanC [Lasiodiplodia theobromae]